MLLNRGDNSKIYKFRSSIISMVSEGSMYNYSSDFQIATQMKSWMAINPSFGCVWDCAYCIQHKDKFFDTSNYKRIHKIRIDDEVCTPEDVVSEIMVNPRITSRTPLIFYNLSDPFLPQNSKDLESILSILDKRKFTNIVGFIARTFADMDTLDAIAGLKNIRPIVLVSYAGYDNKTIERGPLNKRVELLRELKSRNIPALQYLRPIAREWVEKDQFKRARDAVGSLVDGVIMSGIRLTPEVIKKIKSRGLPVPKVPNYTNKFFPKDLQEEIIEVYKGVTPVYRYTSCGVSATLGIADYNAHLGFLRETQNNEFAKCPLPCEGGQLEICINHKPAKEPEFKSLLDRIGHSDVNFIIKSSGAIELDKEVSKEDLSFLRHNTSCHVDYKGNAHHIDHVVGIDIKTGRKIE